MAGLLGWELLLRGPQDSADGVPVDALSLLSWANPHGAAGDPCHSRVRSGLPHRLSAWERLLS